MARLLHADLRSIATSNLLLAFGASLVEFFVPLLLLQSGLELWQVCFFFIAYSGSKILVNYPSILLINRYGARLGLLIGYSCETAYFGSLTLYIGDVVQSALFVAPLALAMRNSFLWNSQHLHISRVMDPRRKSRDLAMIASLMRLAGICGPLIGGILATWGSHALLLTVATAIVFLAVIPAWGMDRLAGGHQRQKSVKYNLRGAPPRDLVANFAFNSHVLVGMTIWPMYLAIELTDVTEIGLIATTAAAVTFALLHFAGRRGDRGKNHRVLLEATIITSVAHLARVFAITPITITIVSSFYSTALSYQVNPWSAIYYGHTREAGINYIMSMEIAGDLAHLTMWTSLGLAAFYWGDTEFFNIAFSCAALLTWFCLIISKEKHKTAQDSSASRAPAGRFVGQITTIPAPKNQLNAESQG